MSTSSKEHLTKELNLFCFEIFKNLDSKFENTIDDYTDFSSKFFSNKIWLTKSIRKGLPNKLFILIRELTPFTEHEWADYLNISLKTLYRIKKNEEHIFKPIHSEKILELTEVTKAGLEVFNSAEDFYTWLNTKSIALSNIEPAELLKDSYGKELVMDELNRIEHGIFA